MKYLQLIFISISLISCREIDAKKEYFKSLSYYKNGNYDMAIKSFSEIINQTDTCFDCYLHRGFAYRDFNQPGLAQNDFNKLINSELEKNQKLGFINRGGTYYDQREYKLALDDYKKALEYEPQNNIILNMVSHMYFATGDKDSGCYYFRKSIQFGKTEFNSEIPIYCDSILIE